MGNGHTHRNKRGGRHNRGGGAPRGPGAGASAGASATGQTRPVTAPSAQPVPAPAPHSAPSSDVTPPALPAAPAPAPQRHASAPGAAGGRSRSEPSLRAPYAPGQRAPRGAHQPAPPIDRQPLELELASSSYEEFVVTTRGVETTDDQTGAPESPAADQNEAFAPPGPRAQPVHLPPAPRYNGSGHTHDGGRHNGHSHERERERDYERTETPAYQRPAFDREGDRADAEAAMLAGEDRDAPEMSPRGDVRGEVGALIDDLKALFQRDRATASAAGGTRCGICYLHFALDELEYRDDEGYYVCPGCARSLGAARVPMVRRQKRG